MLAGGLAFAATGAPSAGAAVAATDVPTAIVVHKCPTGSALPPRPMPRLPVNITVDVPAQYRGGLAVYADGMGAKMLAPKGWACQAQYGADGTGGMNLSPPGRQSGPRSEMIDAATTGDCAVCAQSVACDMFKSAAAAFTPAVPGAKCPRRPQDETVVQLSPNIVAFEIPAHAQGEGDYPDNGVLTYYPKANEVPLTWTGDCILSPSERSLCTVVLNQFIIWDGGRRGPGVTP
jgi:hypothetical protein